MFVVAEHLGDWIDNLEYDGSFPLDLGHLFNDAIG